MQILIEGLSRDYFTAFRNKDSQTLSKMFDSDIELVDWEVDLKGKELVMANNQDLFDSVKEIKITPELIAVYGLTAMAKISVEVDSVKLKVVDIITFNNLGRIIKIEAYRQ